MTLAAGCAPAPEPEQTLPSTPPRVGGPPQSARWLSAPQTTPADYPASGPRSRAVRVVVRCRIVASGVPDSCGVVSQRPQNSGFGEGAVTAVQRGRLDPATISATDIGQTFDVQVVFGPR